MDLFHYTGNNVEIKKVGTMVENIIKNHFFILFIASFFLGLDKGGLKTLLVVCMYFLTMIVDSKYMLSILAPIMFIGDIIPIYIYRA